MFTFSCNFDPGGGGDQTHNFMEYPGKLSMNTSKGMQGFGLWLTY